MKNSKKIENHFKQSEFKIIQIQKKTVESKKISDPLLSDTFNQLQNLLQIQSLKWRRIDLKS